MSSSALFTVPSDTVYIVRSIALYSTGVATAAFFTEEVADLYWASLPVSSLRSVPSPLWQGREVFLAGQEMGGQADASLVFARVCGYVLSA